MNWESVSQWASVGRVFCVGVGVHEGRRCGYDKAAMINATCLLQYSCSLARAINLSNASVSHSSQLAVKGSFTLGPSDGQRLVLLFLHTQAHAHRVSCCKPLNYGVPPCTWRTAHTVLHSGCGGGQGWAGTFRCSLSRSARRFADTSLRARCASLMTAVAWACSACMAAS